jgi:peptidoglycan/LPS O-acetylase OafA/YrhL
LKTQGLNFLFFNVNKKGIQNMAEPKPKGSGWFAAGAGTLFLTAFILLFFFDPRDLDPHILFMGWLIFAAAILLIWGIKRIKKGRDDWTVGQDTINFVVAIVGATIAILTILLDKK